jgi:hypothetical protein
VVAVALGGRKVVDRGEYFVDQLRRRFRGAYGDSDGLGDSTPVADLSLASRAVGQMLFVSRGSAGALDQGLQAQMG